MVPDSEFPDLLDSCLLDCFPDFERRTLIKNHINQQIADLQQSMNLAGAWPTLHQCFVYLVMQANDNVSSNNLSRQA